MELTDVQQEINGLLYFDRQPKLPLAVLIDMFGEGEELDVQSHLRAVKALGFWQTPKSPVCIEWSHIRH